MILPRAVALLSLAGCSISGASFSHDPSSDDMPSGGDDSGDDGGADGNITIRLHVSFTDIGITQNAETVWLRDGSGAWQVLTGSDGVYRAMVTSDRFTVAAACTSGQDASMTVVERMVSDGPIVPVPRCVGSVQPSPIATCTAAALGSAGFMASSAFDASLTTQGDAVGVRTPVGSTELVATKILDGVSQSVIRHGAVDIEADTAASFDFASEGAAVAVYTVTSNDAASYVDSYVNTPHGRYRIQDELARTTPSLTYAALPANLLQADDLMEVMWLGSSTRTTTKLTRGGQVELDVMTQPAFTKPTLDTTDTLRPVFTLPIQPAALPNVHYELGTLTNLGGESRIWLAIVSDAWVQATSATTYMPPSFEDLPGYDPARYALVTGGLSGAQIVRSESSTTERVLGREVRTALAQFTLGPP